MTEVRSILKQIEQTNGRTPESKKEGRIPLDIDLLSYDQQVLKPEDWQKEYVRLAFVTPVSHNPDGYNALHATHIVT